MNVAELCIKIDELYPQLHSDKPQEVRDKIRNEIQECYNELNTHPERFVIFDIVDMLAPRDHKKDYNLAQKIYDKCYIYNWSVLKAKESL